jgi:hypothetical protein
VTLSPPKVGVLRDSHNLFFKLRRENLNAFEREKKSLPFRGICGTPTLVACKGHICQLAECSKKQKQCTGGALDMHLTIEHETWIFHYTSALKHFGLLPPIILSNAIGRVIDKRVTTTIRIVLVLIQQPHRVDLFTYFQDRNETSL